MSHGKLNYRKQNFSLSLLVWGEATSRAQEVLGTGGCADVTLIILRYHKFIMFARPDLLEREGAGKGGIHKSRNCQGVRW